MIKNLNNVKILLIDDDDGDARSVERAFQKAKIANPITRAIDGIDAFEILRGENGKRKLQPPYILLVDINMPRMDGIDFLETIRDDENLRQTIIFMLTTSKNEEDKIKAYNKNVAGYIVKETAGRDFLKLTNLMDIYWRIVELPAE